MIWDHDSQISKVGKDICEELTKAIIKESVRSFDVLSKARTSKNSAGEEEYYSPDGAYYLIEAGGESLRIKIADYEALTTEAVPGRFIGNDEVELASGGGGDFLIKAPRSGAVAINSFVYRIRRKNAVTVPGQNVSMSSKTVGAVGSILVEFQRQVEDNLFLADLEHYSLITKSLQKYSGGK